MPRPTTLPRWADGGSANIVEPPSGKKDVGFTAGERPPAEYFDWLFNTTYEYIAYVDDRLHGSNTIIVPASVGAQATTSPTAAPSSGSSPGSVIGTLDGDNWIIPISQYLPVGSRITGIRVIVEDVAGTTVRATAQRLPLNVGGANQGAIVAIGSTANSDQSGNVQELEVLTGGTEVVAVGNTYSVVVLALAGGTVEIHAVEIDYDRPEL